MQMVLLNAKTTAPQAFAETVERERLYDLLRSNASKQVTLIQAPAGYGKTTLLSQWFNLLKDPVAWLSIDDADNDPIRFWKYVVHNVSESTKKDINEILSPLFNLQEQTSLEFLIDSFLSEIGSIPQTLHIVFDDYHLIQNEAIHKMMTQFIEYLPKNVQIYLTSRKDVLLPITKWRAKSRLKEISMEQLRFTFKEVQSFFHQRDITYRDAESLQYVLEKTEGWVTGLLLASLATKDIPAERVISEAIDSKHPFITDFLLQEILVTLSPSVQEFLVRTSLLSSLEPAVCDALTSRTDSYDILLELEKNGLFIVRLNSNPLVFRYHHLLTEALQVELRNRFTKVQVLSIVKEAATLMRENGDFIAAIELTLNEQAFELAESWITFHLVDLFTSGQTTTFMRWVQIFRSNNFPVPYEMLVMDVIALIAVLEIEEAGLIMQELEYRQITEQWMDKSENQAMATIYEKVKAFVLFGMDGNMEQAAEIVRKQLEKETVSSRWDDIPMKYNLFEHKILRTNVGAKGKLVSFEQGIPFAKLFRESTFKTQSINAFSYGSSAETLYEKNYMEEASEELELALQYGHQFKDPGLFIPMYILKSHIYAMKKQFISAHAILNHAIENVKEKHWVTSLQIMKAHCYLLEGNLLQAKSELTHTKSRHPFWLLVHARLLLAQEQVGDALSTIISVKSKATLEDQVSTIIEATTLEAICHLAMDNEEAALTALHEALKQGEPYGYVRTFLDESAIIPLLTKYLAIRQKKEQGHWNTVPLSYVEHIIQSGDKKKNASILLTPRELEIFALLKNGSTNREIAKHLFLTEGTVRVYLTNIYGKLGVKSRTQAILVN